MSKLKYAQLFSLVLALTVFVLPNLALAENDSAAVIKTNAARMAELLIKDHGVASTSQKRESRIDWPCSGSEIFDYD